MGVIFPDNMSCVRSRFFNCSVRPAYEDEENGVLILNVFFGVGIESRHYGGDDSYIGNSRIKIYSSSSRHFEFDTNEFTIPPLYAGEAFYPGDEGDVPQIAIPMDDSDIEVGIVHRYKGDKLGEFTIRL